VPRKGEKCITLNEKDFNVIEKIADRKKWSLKTVVLDALEQVYPDEFIKE